MMLLNLVNQTNPPHPQTMGQRENSDSRRTVQEAHPPAGLQTMHRYHGTHARAVACVACWTSHRRGPPSASRAGGLPLPMRRPPRPSGTLPRTVPAFPPRARRLAPGAAAPPAPLPECGSPLAPVSARRLQASSDQSISGVYFPQPPMANQVSDSNHQVCLIDKASV